MGPRRLRRPDLGDRRGTGHVQPGRLRHPARLQGARHLGPLGSTVRWKPSQYVTLADASHAWWDGTQWRVGITPIDATAGAPGTYDPPTATFVSVASLALVRPLPSTPWAAGQYVPLTGPEARAHWNGSAWVVNASPGYGTSPGRWGTTTGKGRWGLSTWKTGP